MLVTSPPYPYRAWCGDYTLKLPSSKVYLTFDDGPDPEVTPRVLDILAEAGINGTFFCIGQNAATNPDLIDRIRKEGHAVGNHLWSHKSSWKITENEFREEFRLCSEYTGSQLFRPPFGHFKNKLRRLLPAETRICLWNLLTYDYSAKVSARESSELIRKKLTGGSVIVFHDRKPLLEKLNLILPELVLEIRAKQLQTASII